MSIKVTCACGKTLSVKDEFAGRKVKCPACQQVLNLPPARVDEAALNEDWDWMLSDKAPSISQDAKQSASAALQKTKVGLGISCVYFGFLLMLAVICGIFVALPVCGGNALILLQYFRVLIFLGIAANIVTTVGKLLCLTAPSKLSNIDGIYMAVACDLLALSISIFGMFMVLPPVVTASTYLLSNAAMVCFIWFLKQLGHFMAEREIVKQADGLLKLGIWIVVLWLSMLGLMSFRGSVLVVGMRGLILIVLIVLGTIGLILYLKLLSACRAALRTTEDRHGHRPTSLGLPNPVVQEEAFHEEWGKPDPAQDIFLFLADDDPVNTSRRKVGAAATQQNPVSSELRLTRASKVRAGISCYFFGFLLTFFAMCYLVVTPTLHQGNVQAIARVIVGVIYVSLLSEIIVAVGLGLCLTAPQTMRRRDMLILAVLASCFGVWISGASLWNPMIRFQVGSWLPLIVYLTTHLSFALFVRGLGEFIGNAEIKRQATRVAVFLSLFSVSWLGMLCGHPLHPHMIARGVTVGLLFTLAMLAVWMYSGILGFFQTLRLLSTCRAALRNEGDPEVSHEGRESPALAAAWLSRSDVLKLSAGGVVVGLLFWGLILRPVKPAPGTFAFPVAAPGEQPPTAQSSPEMASRMYTLSRLAATSPHASFKDFQDGIGDTVLGGMVSDARSVPWTKPDDLIFDDTFQSKENSLVEGAVMFGNGSIRHVQIQAGLDQAKFRSLFTIGGREPNALSSLYPPGHQFAPLTYKSVQDQVRQAEARSANKNSLKEIMQAFHNYHEVFNHFPPAVVYGPDGKPWHSWRVVILPFLGRNDLYEKYDGSVPWDHPNNAAVLEQMPSVFRDPLSDKPDSHKTPYLLVTGAGTAFPTKPTGNVVAPAPAQPPTAQPAPLKPLVKDGRQPIEYQPFRPDVWKAKNQSTWLYPWEGERIVLLTTTADLDPQTMAVFVKQLDAGWKLCSELVGQSPHPLRAYNGKVMIAAVPDASFCGGGLVAYLGMGGIEVGGFYVPQGDYDQVKQNPKKFPDGFFFGIGQNHFVSGSQCGVLSTGGIVALRQICAEAINGSDKDPQADQTIYRYEDAFAKSNATFQEAFAPFGATKPFVLNDLDGKPLGDIDQNLFIASTFLKLRKDNGGDEWVRRFFRHLATCPPVAARDIDGAKAQTLNWVVAASLAAEQDLSTQFRDRWRFPLAPEVWQSLQTVDWKKPGLTADHVFDALPSDHLLPSVAMARPGFLTPERRKQNLLVGGTFEDGSGGTWTVGSFRRNAAAASVEGGVANEGQKAVVIRAPINDDARYLQTVAVKPNTRYLVSGWIKTKDVVIVEPTGRTGANLSIDAHTYEMSQSVVGTNDWRYASFVFDSGTRTEVLVCARIGFVYSTATGEAWFDDLCMIPMGESPQRPTAPPPAATITTNKDWRGWPKDTPPPAIAPFNAEQAKQHQDAWAKHLGVPVEYTNSIGMKFRLIPPGEFTMGSTADEVAVWLKQGGLQQYARDGIQSEAPQHRVILTQPVYLGTHEATQQQYEAVTGNNPSHFALQGRGKDAVKGIDTKNHPVEMVGWSDASDFMVRLAHREGRPANSASYRLPTEAEWEFACRAGTTTTYWIGDSEDNLYTAAWLDKNSDQRTHAVGELKANPFGLFDIHGNVWEWVREAWELKHYEQFRDKPAIDPVFEPQPNSECLIRGGNWLNHAPAGRSSGRLFLRMNPPYRLYHLGFRAALSVEAVKAALANPVPAQSPSVKTSGKELRRLEGHQGPVSKAVFSTDGKRVLSGSGFPNGDSTMRLWDVETGREIRKFGGEGKNWVFGVALSPDGKQALSGSDDSLHVWDVETGAVLRRMDFESTNKTVLTVAFSPDGMHAVSGGVDRVVRLWDLASGAQIRTLTGHQGRVMSVAFSPDGSQIASCGLDADKTVRLWNTETGKEIYRLEGHTAGVESVAFTPDGSRVVSSGFDGLILWDAKSGKLIRKIAGEAINTLEAVFFSDGRRVLLGSTTGRVSIWDSETGLELQRLAEGSAWVWTVAVSPDGRRGVSAGGITNINGKWVDGKDFAIRLWSLPDSNTSPDDSQRPVNHR